jgi:hypothetical protein
MVKRVPESDILTHLALRVEVGIEGRVADALSFSDTNTANGASEAEPNRENLLAIRM